MNAWFYPNPELVAEKMRRTKPAYDFKSEPTQKQLLKRSIARFKLVRIDWRLRRWFT